MAEHSDWRGKTLLFQTLFWIKSKCSHCSCTFLELVVKYSINSAVSSMFFSLLFLSLNQTGFFLQGEKTAVWAKDDITTASFPCIISWLWLLWNHWDCDLLVLCWDRWEAAMVRSYALAPHLHSEYTVTWRHRHADMDHMCPNWACCWHQCTQLTILMK